MGLRIRELRKLTFCCGLILFTAGILSGIFIAKNIPLLGLIERISIYTYQMWSVVITFFLIRISRQKEVPNEIVT